MPTRGWHEWSKFVYRRSVAAAGDSAAAAAGHRISACGYHLRAGTYLLIGALPGSRTPRRPESVSTTSGRGIGRVGQGGGSSARGEHVEIPYEDTTLPGYFFRAPDAEPGERRPLVVVNNGSDGATSDALLGGIAAAERGYHWMTFDGRASRPR